MYYSVLLGRPVNHSISPTLFRLLGNIAGIEYGHIKIDVENKELLQEYLSSLRTLNFCGVNITLPYKIDVMEYLDKFDESASKCGAVNTVIFKNNQMIGYNTDAFGAIMAIEKKLRKILPTDKIVVLGAGGAARAIIYEVYQRSQNITILNRSLERAQKVSTDISAKGSKIKTLPISESNLRESLSDADLVLNATSVGMSPNIEDEIVTEKIFDGIKNIQEKYFFDAIFNPYETKFLAQAEKRGAKVCSGLYMMIYQAIAALKLWTGHDLSSIDIEQIKEEIMPLLEHKKEIIDLEKEAPKTGEQLKPLAKPAKEAEEI